MNGPLLQVSELSISFRIQKKVFHAVDRLSFSLERGETLCLVGESGCGKTLTALSILGLLPERQAFVSHGHVYFGPQDLLKLTSKDLRNIRGKKISMIFQEPMTALNPVMCVGHQVAEVMAIHTGATRKEAKQRTLDMFHQTGLPDPAARFYDYPHQLSGGMRQRILMAMALILTPQLVLADEPTTALDATIQTQILSLMQTLTKRHHMSILLITHDFGLIAHMPGTVAVMYAGVIMEKAETQIILGRPLHPYTQALIECVPMLGGRKRKQLPTIPGRVPSLQDIPPYCRFFERCERATEKCQNEEPALVEVESGHFVRCREIS